MSSGLVSRFVAGEDTDDAVRVSRSLVEQGLHVTLDHLGEDTTDVEHATAVADAYLTVLGRLADAGLTSGTEVSVKLSAVGQALPRRRKSRATTRCRLRAAPDAARRDWDRKHTTPIRR